MTPRRRRATAIAEAAGANALVVAHPSAVTWLTGYAPEIETGPSQFALSAIAVLVPGGNPVLIVSDDEGDAAAATGCEVTTYPGFGIIPCDPVGATTRALRSVLDGPSVAIDAGSLPVALALGLDWVDVSNELSVARTVKDPDEIELIRAAIAACDVGQRAARAYAAPGVSELELWAAVRGAMESHVGARLPVLADLVSGPRTAEIGGPPSARVIAEGDLVLCDLVPRVDGYWGDSCATFAIGDPSAAAQAAHAESRATLADVISAIRPGAIAGELDARARAQLAFPHHTGHGLGTTWHEEPRLIPDSTTALEAGMIVAIEPGSYESAGVRLEQIVLVTAEGCDVLSSHDLSL
jgi:Xaa-Pro dipeptidase